MGSYATPYPSTLSVAEARASFGFNDDDVVMTFVGRIEPYKGVDLLLSAGSLLPATSKIKFLVAGLCSDHSYREELAGLADEIQGRVTLTFDWVPDTDLARYLLAADVGIFAFREITNSGSVTLVQSFGKPAVIPNLTTLADIPADSAIRYEPGVDSLVLALQQAENLSAKQYREMSAAALAWATRRDWSDVARETVEVYAAASSSG
jgi:glycosyltransferase involved in cell wall biosynthesis